MGVAAVHIFTIHSDYVTDNGVSFQECENLRVQSDEDSRRCNALTRENERLHKQSADLGRQVRNVCFGLYF